MSDGATVFLQSNGILGALSSPQWYPEFRHVVGGGIDYYGPGTDPDSLYRDQRAIRTVTGFIARNIASIALHGFEWRDVAGHDEPERCRVRGTPVLKSPDRQSTLYEYMRDATLDVLLWERFAAAKIKHPDGNPLLLRLPPRRWHFKRNKGSDQPIAIQIGEDEYPLEHFLWTDGYPASAVSPMSHLTSLLFEESESAKYRASLWKNGARVGGVVRRPLEAPDWSPKARARFRRLLVEGFTGDEGSNLGGTMLLEDGMEYTPLERMSSRDAQQIEARKLSTSEVAAAFHVPPVFVGVLDDANYSNVNAYKQMLYSDVLGPILQQKEQAWTLRVADSVPQVDFFEFNVGEKLRLSFEEQARVLFSAVGAPYMTRNEGRSRLNLKRVEDGDDLVNPIHIIPPEEISDEAKAKATREEQLADAQRVAELIQKIYLGVGVLLTAEEARNIIREAGVPLAAGTPSGLNEEDNSE